MKSQGKLLKEFIDNLTDYSINELTTILEKSKQGVYNLYNKPVFSRSEILLFENVLNIKPKYFGVTLEQPSIYLESEFISYQMERKIGKNYLEFLEDYHKLLSNFIEQAENSIIVLDYLADNSAIPKKLEKNGFDSKLFYNLYSDYSENITAIIKKKKKKNKNFQYTRILQLPLGCSERIKNNPMELIYKETLKHFEDTYKFDKQFKVYVLEKAIRPFSFIILDKKAILTEYDYYDKNSNAFPDLAFVERVPNILTKRLIETHEIQLKKIKNSSDKELTRERAIYDIRNSIYSIEVEVESLNENILSISSRIAEILKVKKRTTVLLKELEKLTEDKINLKKDLTDKLNKFNNLIEKAEIYLELLGFAKISNENIKKIKSFRQVE